jgi:toluene monooxygenase system protein B
VSDPQAGQGAQGAAPQLVPINALFGTDFVTLLVVVLTTDTMDDVSKKVAANVVGKRIAPRDAEMAVYFRDEIVPRDRTVAEAGIEPMQFVFVDYVDDAEEAEA